MTLVTCGWPSRASIRKQQANLKRGSWILIRQDKSTCFYQSSWEKSCNILRWFLVLILWIYIFLRTSKPKIKLQKGVQYGTFKSSIWHHNRTEQHPDSCWTSLWDQDKDLNKRKLPLIMHGGLVAVQNYFQPGSLCRVHSCLFFSGLKKKKSPDSPTFLQLPDAKPRRKRWTISDSLDRCNT